MEKSLKIKYYDPIEDSPEDYFAFLKSCYGKLAKEKFTKRSWWFHHVGYKRLIAYLENKIIGQSCSFKNIAIIHNKEVTIWWGIDSYVLAEARGRGIGKKLQKQLHEELPNFSSAWYSPANGHVKHLCGAKELFPIKFYYYPVSSMFNELGQKVFAKLLHRNSPKIRIANLYGCLNKANINGYDIKEIKLTEDLIPFITNSMDKFDFYIKRDWEYMKWRYIDNPSLNYHVLRISKDCSQEGLVFFSDIHEYHGLRIVYHMDQFFSKDSNLNTNTIISIIAQYYKTKEIVIDGIKSLQDCKWIGKLSISRNKVYFLSTLVCGNIQNPYLTYSDQDMVEM